MTEIYMPWAKTPSHWLSFSCPLSDAKTKALRKLLIEDKRIIGFSKEGADGVFIYTDSGLWCDDAGVGQFAGQTEAKAARNFKAWVMSRAKYEATNEQQ